jgi:hypothetical protein
MTRGAPVAMTELDIDTFENSLTSHRPELMPVHPYLFVVLESYRPTFGGARYALGGVEEVIIGRGLERAASFETHGPAKAEDSSSSGRRTSSMGMLSPEDSALRGRAAACGESTRWPSAKRRLGSCYHPGLLE